MITYKAWIPRSVTTLCKGRINQDLMEYVRSWQWHFAKQPYSAECLGESMRQRHAQRWDEEWKRATLSGRHSLVFAISSRRSLHWKWTFVLSKNEMHALNSIVVWTANHLVWSALPSSFFDTLNAQKRHLLHEKGIHSARAQIEN